MEIRLAAARRKTSAARLLLDPFGVVTAEGLFVGKSRSSSVLHCSVTSHRQLFGVLHSGVCVRTGLPCLSIAGSLITPPTASWWCLAAPLWRESRHARAIQPQQSHDTGISKYPRFRRETVSLGHRIQSYQLYRWSHR
jgi:hypothetical protein